jgi:hypothetical protein
MLTGLSWGAAPMARALGCTHYVSMRQPWGGQLAYLPVPRYGRPEGRGAKVFALLDPIPPAFVAREPSLSSDEKVVFQRVKTATTVARTLEIVDDPGARLGSSDLARWSGRGVTRASVERKASDQALVHAEGTGGALLGIRTAFALGWTARQGDKELPCVRVAGAQVGALVDDVSGGDVVFEYRWPKRAQSIGAALVGCLALALGLLIPQKKRT